MYGNLHDRLSGQITPTAAYSQRKSLLQGAAKEQSADQQYLALKKKAENQARASRDRLLSELQEVAWDEFKDALVPLLENGDKAVLDHVAEFIYRMGHKAGDKDINGLMPLAKKLYFLDCLMMEEEPQKIIK